MSAIVKNITNTELKDYIPIIFQGGTYGSFLLFCIGSINNALGSDPFEDSGSSHLFDVNVLDKTIDSFQVKIRNNTNFLKYHPKCRETDNLISNIEELTDITKKGILVYPSKNHYLLTINNFADKVHSNDLSKLHREEQETKETMFANLYDGWNIAKDTSVNSIDRWIMREFFSYNRFKAFDAEHHWYFLDEYKNKNEILIITTDELLFDFKNTITKVAEYIGYNTINNIDELVKLQKKQLSLQKHLHKDRIVYNIIEGFFNNNNTPIDDLSVYDEAYIQYKLRLKGYEIKCRDLNVFPRNTKELQKICYQPAKQLSS